MKRRGRPPSENPRNRYIGVPMTQEQKLQVEDMARSRNVSVGSLIRSIVFDRQDELVAA